MPPRPFEARSGQVTLNLARSPIAGSRSKTGCLSCSTPNRSGPRRVLDRAERPVAFQPFPDPVVKHWVEFRTVRAHPGTDGRALFTLARAALAFAARRVDVHAADDFN